MGFQSIFGLKALPEAAFVKKAVIDAHRSKHESIASGWLHRSARPILPQASPVWKVWNLPDCCLRARESVRRASGFVQTGNSEVTGRTHRSVTRAGQESASGTLSIDCLEGRLWPVSGLRTNRPESLLGTVFVTRRHQRERGLANGRNLHTVWYCVL